MKPETKMKLAFGVIALVAVYLIYNNYKSKQAVLKTAVTADEESKTV